MKVVKSAVSRDKGVRHEPAAPTVEFLSVSAVYGKGKSGSLLLNGRSLALKDASFKVYEGERIAVVGPNGAGKSTLLKLIAGTLKPARGQVNVYGHRPVGHICIAYVPQRSEIDWDFPATVEDVVMMGRVGQIGLFRWPRRSDWSVVRRCLQRVGMVHLAQKQIGQLSGGQQQRAFIARALAQEAELLLLDEPLAGLDAPSRDAIFDVLDGMREERITVLLATHDLQLASHRFERVMLLNGRIIAFGAPTAVFQPDNLLRAYGGHMHVISEGHGTIVLADSCCDHGLHGR